MDYLLHLQERNLSVETRGELGADLTFCCSLQSHGPENTNWRRRIDVVLNGIIYWLVNLSTDGEEIPNVGCAGRIQSINEVKSCRAILACRKIVEARRIHNNQ